MHMPQTRRAFLQYAACGVAGLAQWVSSARAEEPSLLRVSRILGAEYREDVNRVWLFAEEGDRASTAPLLAEDLIALARAVWALPAETDSFMFSLEPIGDRMVPFFAPREIGPLLSGSRAAMTIQYCDVLLKGAALALPFATELGLQPSEIDLLAADISRQNSQGSVEDKYRSVHKFFFTMTGVSTPSDDWLRVSFPNPAVAVILAPPVGTDEPLFPERQFAQLMQARFRELLRRRGFVGDETRRLFQLFLCFKCLGWMKDIGLRIDRARLAAYHIPGYSFPRIPVQQVSRTIASATGQYRVQLEGGALFHLRDWTRTPMPFMRGAGRDEIASARVHRVVARTPTEGPRDTDRSPPVLACEPVLFEDHRAVRIDVSSLLGLV